MIVIEGNAPISTTLPKKESYERRYECKTSACRPDSPYHLHQSILTRIIIVPLRE